MARGMGGGEEQAAGGCVGRAMSWGLGAWDGMSRN